MKKKETFDFYDTRYGWHQNTQHEKKAKKPFSLTLEIKEKAIHLLFGSVTDENRKKLYKYMDERFKQCHSLALYISDKERKRDVKESKFTVICENLGIDPGRREVQVTDNMQVLYSDDYAIPAMPV